MLKIKRHYKLYRTIQKVIYANFAAKYEDYLVNDIKIKIFRSPNNQIIFYIHGGGWTLGSAQTYVNACNRISKQLNRTVISIDYRLAPEYPFPTGFNDCYNTIKAIISNYQRYHISLKDIIIMGDSAGANLATAVAIKAKKSKEFQISKEILLYPLTQTDFSKYSPYKSITENANNYFLSRQNVQEYLKLYVKDKKDLNSPYIAPLKSKNLFKMPKTLIITAEFDILRDEGYAYAKKLKRYFNKVEYHNLPKTIHGFFTNYLCFKDAEQAMNYIKLFIGDANE